MTKEFVDEVVVIDDGSKDSTASIASSAGATLIPHAENKGKAAALMNGFHYAFDGGFDAAVMIDSDGQNDPYEIPIVLKPVMERNVDLVVGSRFLETKSDIPRYRQLGQKVLNIATSFSSKNKTSDSQSGFRALSREGLRCMLKLESEGYNIESDMLNRAQDYNLIVTEVPVSVNYDVPNGHKKNPVVHGFSVLGRIVNVMGYRRPLLLFGVSGMFMLVLGTVLYLARYLSIEPFASISAITLWSAALMLFGGGSILAGLILNSQVMLKKELMDLRQEIHSKK